MLSEIKTNSAQKNTLKPWGLQSYTIKDFYRDSKLTRLLSTASEINSQCRQRRSMHEVSPVELWILQMKIQVFHICSLKYLKLALTNLAAHYWWKEPFCSLSPLRATHLFYSSASLGTKLAKITPWISNILPNQHPKLVHYRMSQH